MAQEKLHVDNPSKKERENCITDNKTSGEDKQSHFQGELTCWWICWFREVIESQKKKETKQQKEEEEVWKECPCVKWSGTRFKWIVFRFVFVGRCCWLKGKKVLLVFKIYCYHHLVAFLSLMFFILFKMLLLFIGGRLGWRSSAGRRMALPAPTRSVFAAPMVDVFNRL